MFKSSYNNGWITLRGELMCCASLKDKSREGHSWINVTNKLSPKEKEDPWVILQENNTPIKELSP